MALRYIYKIKEPEQRICVRCGKIIQRNVAVMANDKRLWHYGCLQEAKHERLKCTKCKTVVDGTFAKCPNCGSLLALASQFPIVMIRGETN